MFTGFCFVHLILMICGANHAGNPCNRVSYGSGFVEAKSVSRSAERDLGRCPEPHKLSEESLIKDFWRCGIMDFGGFILQL